MSTPVVSAGNYKNLTATGTVYTGPGSLYGIFVASASNTPTIKVEDSAGVTLINTFTPVSATFYPMPFRFNTALKVTISGTVDCTVGWGT